MIAIRSTVLLAGLFSLTACAGTAGDVVVSIPAFQPLKTGARSAREERGNPLPCRDIGQPDDTMIALTVDDSRLLLAEGSKV